MTKLTTITGWMMALAAPLVLAGCETPLTPRYALSVDNQVGLRGLHASDIQVGTIAEPSTYDVACRLQSHLRIADGLTHAQYIRKALEDELKAAGAITEGTPRVTLTGAVTALNVASMHGLTRGEWDIALHLQSSNGKAMDVSEQYAFKSGFSADAACTNTAQAFTPAVQDLIRQVVTSPQFQKLVS